MKKLILLLATVLFTLTTHAQLTANTDSTTLLKKGDMAVNFSVQRYNGTTAQLSDYKGKVVLLVFWGSWCPPCLKELLPENLPKEVLNKFSNNKDFVFFPISVSENREKLEAFFNSERGQNLYAYLSKDTGIDQKRDIFHLYATQGVPRTVVIGRDGKIVYTSVGYEDNHEGLKAMEKAIQEALKK